MTLWCRYGNASTLYLQRFYVYYNFQDDSSRDCWSTVHEMKILYSNIFYSFKSILYPTDISGPTAAVTALSAHYCTTQTAKLSSSPLSAELWICVLCAALVTGHIVPYSGQSRGYNTLGIWQLRIFCLCQRKKHLTPRHGFKCWDTRRITAAKVRAINCVTRISWISSGTPFKCIYRVIIESCKIVDPSESH